METIIEKKIDTGNNEVIIIAAIYKTKDGYEWMTISQSGTCKTLKTAYKKIAHVNF